MTSNVKRLTTTNATKPQNTLRKPINRSLLSDWNLLSTDPNPVESALNVKTNYDPNVWQLHGLCSFCHLAIEVRERGKEVRHVDSHILFGECEAAKRASGDSVILWGPPLISESVFREAIAFNERHRDILEDPKNDPLDRKNWLYFPAHDGNKARRIYRPFEGLK